MPSLQKAGRFKELKREAEVEGIRLENLICLKGLGSNEDE